MLNAQFSHPPQFPPARNHPTNNSPTIRAWRNAVDNHGPAWPEPRRGSWGSTGYLPTPPSSFDYSQERSTLPHKPDSERTDMNGYYNQTQEPVSHNTGSYNVSNNSSRQDIGGSASVPPAASHLSQPSYKSSRPTSTVPSRVASPVFESYPSRRGSANDGIHPYLQLPPTISPSGGSVTEFAAQVRPLLCLDSLFRVTLTTYSDNVSLLVRIFHSPLTHRRHHRVTATTILPSSGCCSHYWFSQVGYNDSVDHTSHTECGSSGSTVHSTIEEPESHSERKAWERVPAVDSCVDAGQ